MCLCVVYISMFQYEILSHNHTRVSIHMTSCRYYMHIHKDYLRKCFSFITTYTHTLTNQNILILIKGQYFKQITLPCNTTILNVWHFHMVCVVLMFLMGAKCATIIVLNMVIIECLELNLCRNCHVTKRNKL